MWDEEVRIYSISGVSNNFPRGPTSPEHKLLFSLISLFQLFQILFKREFKRKIWISFFGLNDLIKNVKISTFLLIKFIDGFKFY